MSDFQDYLDRALRQVKLENFEDEPKHQDYDINAEVSAIIFSVRTSLGMTQKQLEEKSRYLKPISAKWRTVAIFLVFLF